MQTPAGSTTLELSSADPVPAFSTLCPWTLTDSSPISLSPEQSRLVQNSKKKKQRSWRCTHLCAQTLGVVQWLQAFMIQSGFGWFIYSSLAVQLHSINDFLQISKRNNFLQISESKNKETDCYYEVMQLSLCCTDWHSACVLPVSRNNKGGDTSKSSHSSVLHTKLSTPPLLTSLSLFCDRIRLSLSTIQIAIRVIRIPWPKSPNITANRNGKVMMVYGAVRERHSWCTVFDQAQIYYSADSKVCSPLPKAAKSHIRHFHTGQAMEEHHD